MRAAAAGELFPRLHPSLVLAEACRRAMARLVWNALHTPLTVAGRPLQQVPKGDRRVELEFYFTEYEGTR